MNGAHGTRRSAGIVIVRRIDGVWYVLLLRSFRNWDFPKGLIEPGETPLAAARREAQEETNLTDFDFRWGEGFRETVPYAGGKIARYYLAESPRGEVALPVNPELGTPEHHEYRWAALDRAHELLPPRLAPILQWAMETLASGPD